MDAKFIGLKALDVLTGIGAAVAGGYGGPDAAKGVMMAGGAIKDITGEATGGEERSRADRHDRADFQAREAVVAKKQEAAALSADDRASGRAELMKLGWSAEKADMILSGPRDGVTVAALTSETPQQGQTQKTPQNQQAQQMVASNQAKPEEQNGVGAVLGKLLKGATATRVAEQPGKVVSGAEATNDSDAYQGTQVLSSIGTLIKGASSQKA